MPAQAEPSIDALESQAATVVSVSTAVPSRIFIPISADTVEQLNPVIEFEVSGQPMAIAPSGAILASSGPDRSVQLWDLERGVLLHDLGGNDGDVYSAAFSPDGSYLAVLSGGTIGLWRVSDGSPVSRLIGHSSAVTCAVFSPDGAHLASIAIDGVRLWKVPGGELVYASGGLNWVGMPWSSWCTLAFSPDGQLLAGPAGDGVTRSCP